MSATPMLQAQLRKVSSRGELRKIRSQGQVPGIVYGKGLESPVSISLDAKELAAMLRSHPHAVVEMEVPGTGKHPVMMAELQRDFISHQVTHIDFRRINMNEKITTLARLDIIGTSPGEKEGGMLQTIQHEIEIQCYPKDIPDAIAVDVSGLGLGDNLTISDLKLPSGVEAVQDSDTVVVALLAPQKVQEEEVAEVAEVSEDKGRSTEAAEVSEKS